MSLILDLPRDVDERLALKATKHGVAKETLAVDLIARSLEDAVGSPPLFEAGSGETDFWSEIDIEALAKEQGVRPIVSFDAWWKGLPSVEGADELVKQVEELRLERREMDRNRK